MSCLFSQLGEGVTNIFTQVGANIFTYTGHTFLHRGGGNKYFCTRGQTYYADYDVEEEEAEVVSVASKLSKNLKL